ncbi:MAG TPA: glycosyltransferase family 9 protein [Gemmatimonadaceae bacterium]|nr:glycosyltransferase family 9 protein [Gemmatimonadaceae bacterium]
MQAGPRAADAAYYPGLTITDPPPRTFADTANLIAGLDGVIAVDTSVCHLAGVLGVPTLTLLRFPCEVKWGLGERSPWYPAMRLIGQPSRGDWASVVTTVRAALDSDWWFSRHVV